MAALVPVTPEVGAAAVSSPVGVLELDTHSSLEADPLESSLPLVSVTPMVLPFLCSDDLESNTEIPERHVSPTTSTPEILTAPILLVPSAMVTPSSEEDIPIGRLYRTYPGGPCRALTARKLVRPLPSHRLTLRYTSHHLENFTSESSSSHSSSDHSLSGYSSLGHSLFGHTPPDNTDADLSTPQRFVHPSLFRTIWCSEAYLRWRSAPLSTMYPPTTSELSAGDSSSESSAGPSCKRCRSPAAIVISPVHSARALVPSHGDLLPPRNRFRDFISPDDSVEKDINTDVLEDIKADATTVKVAVDRDVEARIDRGIDMEVDVGIDVEDEVESINRGTIEVGVDMDAGIDIPDGMLMPDDVEHLEQVEEGLQNIHDHVIEIPLQRIEDIETTQRQLEAGQLITSGERAGLFDRTRSLEREEFRQVCKDRDDTRRRLRRLESFVERSLGFVVGLTRWFEKMETMFHISKCPEKYQVKYATCTLLNSALTWWNSHKRTIGTDVAFAISWKELMNLMAKVYYPRNEFQKMESELWNLAMVHAEEDQIEKYVGGLPENIQGNVMSAGPTRLQDAIRLASNLMDQKLKGYAVKNTENKRRLEVSQRDNRGQQLPFKWSNVGVGFESRPPMLNKENYVPWSSRLLRYANSRPNGKLIHNSIINGTYVRRMIPEPGDTNREIPMNETFHVQTDDELTEKELKQIEADDQAIQTILLGLPEDIYAAVDSCETAQEIWLRVQQMMKGADIGIQEKKAKLFNEWERSHNCNKHGTRSNGKAFKLNYSTPTNNNQRISSNPRNRQIAQPGINMGQDRQMRMVRGISGNQFRQYAGQNARNLNGYNDVQNVRNQVIQHAVQNPRVQNIGNHNGLIGVPGNANQKLNGNGNLVAARAERNAAGYNGNQIRCYNCRGLADLDEIKEVNAKCILMANLQQVSTSGTQTDKAPVYDSNGSAELSKEKSTVSFLFEEKKKLKSDFKTREDELLDKQIQVEKKIKELNNILVKTGQSIQTIRMLSPKPDSFYHTEQKMALGYQNPFYLKKAQKKQQSLYDGKVLLEKHDPPVVHDSEETLQLAQESRQKMKQLNKEIKPANYTKINHLSGVKSTIVTLQHVVKHRMTLETHNWSSSAHQELHKIVKDENFPIVKQVDARVQNFEIQFLKKAAKFVRDFKSLAKETDDSLAKHKALKLEIERLLRAAVSQDIMSVVQKESVVDTSDLQTELGCTKERFENCIIKKENEYAKLWNDWYKKCDECKYDKILYDKAYKDMQQKIEWLQAQLGDLKGKSKDTSCVSDTLNPLSQKLENENVELEFKVLNYAKENAHLKTTYKNLFDSISVSRTQTITIIASLQYELQNTIYENAKLRAQLFKKVFVQKDNKRGTSTNTKFAKQSILGKPPMLGEIHALSKPVTSNLIPSPQEAKVVKNDKKDVNSDSNGLSSTGIDNSKTRRPHHRSNSKNDRVPSASKNSRSKNKEVEVEEHHRDLLLSKNNKHMSSACNNFKLDPHNVISKVVCAMCKQCLISVNHDVCLRNYVNGKTSHGKIIASSESASQSDCSNGDNACTSNTMEPKIKRFPNSTSLLGRKHKANASKNETQQKNQPEIKKSKNVGTHKSLATPKPRKPRFLLRWSPTGKMFDSAGKLVAPSGYPDLFMVRRFRLFQAHDKKSKASHQFRLEVYGNCYPNLFMVRRLGLFQAYDQKSKASHQFRLEVYGNGLGHNLFSVGQFCDSNLEVAFRRNACFVRNLKGVDLLQGDRSTNLYTINLHDMASASPICLMGCTSSTKSWLWHQRLSHLNFDTINNLAKNDLVSGLPKFKYHKEYLCPSCEQGKSKRASHPPKPVPNSRQRLHLLHIDLCGPMRIASINGKHDCYCVFHSKPLHYSPLFNKTPYELINGRKPDISFLYVFGALCYPKNDREDIVKLGAKGDIGFFIGYYADSCAYRFYNRRTKKIMETMNVSFDELSAMAFEQRSSKPGHQTMYDDYIGGQPSATVRTVSAAQAPQ
nr:integrase, catalytic region, zinc finger, CCHC-type, peptidase aspartic, catalytic [Tanacetum cinerariifolium]